MIHFYAPTQGVGWGLKKIARKLESDGDTVKFDGDTVNSGAAIHTPLPPWMLLHASRTRLYSSHLDYASLDQIRVPVMVYKKHFEKWF